MDPEAALELVKNGVTLLLLDVPQYTLVGIDTQVFSVGPAFKGIKMIPPGVHFVFYSSSTRDGKEFSPIIGFFVDAGPSEVIVRKWEQQEERLVKVLEDEEERYVQAVRSLEFDRQLGPYNLSQYGDWKRLSNYITKSTIERLEPIGGEITVTSESGMVKNTPKTSMEKALDEQLRASKFSTTDDNSQKKGCYYTSIPRVIKLRGMQGEELTSLNLDKTQLLESLLIKEYGGSEDSLLGELQFAFISFLMGQSLEAFLQWKSLVSLLFGCTEAPFHTRSQLFIKFIKVVYYQLKYGLQKDRSGTETGTSALLDDSWLSADSFLHHLCKDFFSLVLEASVVDGDLLSWTRKFKELLENSLGWEFQQSSAVDGIYFEENDEYAPVVEMLDDSSYNEAASV
ncbi:protein AAR2 homolog [Pistacia vera]|uniref:protein AAR2 homolog n=1 Tax=Pistacia vera TaxID=55513 RepID=UPI001263CC85|nr:protein AAR2 homolog [Pistacia vera]